MKKFNLTVSTIIILFIILGCMTSKKDSVPVAGKDYEVNVLIDTVLIFDPETGKEIVKIHETRDTVWSSMNEVKK